MRWDFAVQAVVRMEERRRRSLAVVCVSCVWKVLLWMWACHVWKVVVVGAVGGGASSLFQVEAAGGEL